MGRGLGRRRGRRSRSNITTRGLELYSLNLSVGRTGGCDWLSRTLPLSRGVVGQLAQLSSPVVLLPPGAFVVLNVRTRDTSSRELVVLNLSPALWYPRGGRTIFAVYSFASV